jgi:phosphoglycolate phosphatase (TIGR01487 family)
MYIGCSGAVVAENGAIISYEDKFKILGNGTISKKVLEALKKTYAEFEDLWDRQYRKVDLGFKRTLSKDEVSDFVAHFPQVEFRDSGVAYHILDRRVDKGVGLKVAADFMEVPLSDIAVVGDNENDLEMFENAGFTITFANAVEEIQKKADYITSRGGGLGFVEAANEIMARLQRKTITVSYPTSIKDLPKYTKIIERIREYTHKHTYHFQDVSIERMKGFEKVMDCLMRSDLVVVCTNNDKDFIDISPEILYAHWIGKKVIAISPEPPMKHLFTHIYSDPDSLFDQIDNI